MLFFFFFSSRRRHTRWTGDWSSDVCSSDLGEVVEAEPRGRQGGVAVAAATRVLEASPHRVTARCPYFGDCGGCQLQHAAYAHQLQLKRQVVDEAWSRAGLRVPPDAAVLGMHDPWRYRIRGEFEAVASGKG